MKSHKFKPGLIYFITKFLLKKLINVIYSIHITNLYPLDKITGPLIIVTNHLHRLDMLIIILFLDVFIRPIIAEDSVVGHPHLSKLFSILSKITGGIVINRHGAMTLSSSKEILSALRNCDVLLIAPEGTRSKNGEFGPSLLGAAYFSLKTSTPVLPILTYGYATSKVLRKKLISIVIGNLVESQGRLDTFSRESVTEFNIEIEKNIKSSLESMKF